MTKKMTKKQAAHSDTKRSSTRADKKDSGVTNALVNAAVEIGHAAEHIKSSLEHFSKAREKGKDAIEPVERAGKKAVDAVRRRLPGKN